MAGPLTDENGMIAGTVADVAAPAEWAMKAATEVAATVLRDRPDDYGSASYEIEEIARAIEAAGKATVTDPLTNPKTAAEDYGWVEWLGGACPVPYDTYVNVRYTTGEFVIGIAAGFRWDRTSLTTGRGNILAYRRLS